MARRVRSIERLGSDRDRLRQRLRSARTTATAASRGSPASVRADLTAAHLAASLLGWGTHKGWTPRLRDAPPPDALTQMLTDARVFADRSQQGLSALVRLGATPDALERAAELALDQAIAQGWELGGESAAEEAGIEYKTWVRITAVKEPRDWHDDLEGTTILATDLFELPGGPNKGAECDGPHDWDNVDDPAEWINCGHALVYTDSP